MKVKNLNLQNQLKYAGTGDMLFIAAESPKEGFGETSFEYFVDKLRNKTLILVLICNFLNVFGILYLFFTNLQFLVLLLEELCLPEF